MRLQPTYSTHTARHQHNPPVHAPHTAVISPGGTADSSMVLKWLSKVKEVGNFRGPIDWLRCVADGNLFITLFEKGPTGTLVGEDQFGNRYFEDNTTTYNRKRWVIYKDMNSYNPTSVPPEWHGWLNYINDFDPVSHKFKRPIYAIDAGVSKTATLDCYKPKGAWDSPTKRNWLKYDTWQPPKA